MAGNVAFCCHVEIEAASHKRRQPFLLSFSTIHASRNARIQGGRQAGVGAFKKNAPHACMYACRHAVRRVPPCASMSLTRAGMPTVAMAITCACQAHTLSAHTIYTRPSPAHDRPTH
eukprot:365022-Chlamydomonas_euryale.AAC.11